MSCVVFIFRSNFLSTHDQLFFENDGIELVLRAHDHVEERDQDGKAGADHTDQKQSLGLELLLGVADDDQLEKDVDGELGEVLGEERYEAHQLAEDQWPPCEVERVIDAE